MTTSQGKGLHILHATSYKNLKSIIRTSKILVYPKGNNDKMLDETSGFIFSQLVFDDIPIYYKRGQLHWVGECLIELDIDLLKHNKFIICHIGGFEEVKGKSEKELKSMKDVYAYGSGNLKKLPLLTKVKQHILEKISKIGKTSEISYMHSHEVLFMNDIELSFCKRIIVYDKKLYDKIKRYMKQYKITYVDILLLPQQAQYDTELFISKLRND